LAKTPRTWTGARSPSGLKRVRSSERRHAILGPRRATAKTLVKTALIAATSPSADVDPQVALTDAISALDRAAKVGAIHPNAAARRKSRLVRKAKTIGRAAAQKAAKARIAASKADKAKGAQTAAGKARAALSKSSRAEAAAAAAATKAAAKAPAKASAKSAAKPAAKASAKPAAKAAPKAATAKKTPAKKAAKA
jgi:ribosomal protein S20